MYNYILARILTYKLLFKKYSRTEKFSVTRNSEKNPDFDFDPNEAWKDFPRPLLSKGNESWFWFCETYLPPWKTPFGSTGRVYKCFSE